MRCATSLDELEDQWKQFLSRIERVWNKCESHFSRSPKWAGWKGPYEKARKSDPLLSYLRNARGADEHTIAEIVSREPGTMRIGAGSTGSLHLRGMVIRNGEVFVDGDGSIKLTFTPGRVKLLPVTNRGRTYDLPRSHLGRPVDPDNVIEIAEAGLRYYAGLLDSAERAFCAGG